MSQTDNPLIICTSPEKLPKNWREFVHEPISEEESQELQNAIKRGCPLGDPAWQQHAAEILELKSTMRKQGRPAKTICNMDCK